MIRKAKRPALKLTRQISSQLEQVDSLCVEIRALLKEKGLESASFGTELMARECLNNAVIHGNQKKEGKRVCLNLGSTRDWVFLQVADEGEGFNWRTGGKAAPLDSDAPSGRGILIISATADRVRFNRKGNQIALWIRKQRKTSGK